MNEEQLQLLDKMTDYHEEVSKSDLSMAILHSEDCIFIVRSMFNNGYSINQLTAAVLWGEVSGCFALSWLDIGTYSSNDIFEKISNFSLKFNQFKEKISLPVGGQNKSVPGVVIIEPTHIQLGLPGI